MELKKYSKDSNISYCFGAFPTFELINKRPEIVSQIVIHEKLELTNDINKIIKLAKSKRIPVITNGKLIEKLSSKGNIKLMH